MKKLIPFIVLLYACSKNDTTIVKPVSYSLRIDSAINQAGTQSLTLDRNGYYHYLLKPASNQQPFRVTGHILADGKEPYPVERIEWESNLYWWLKKGDTIAYITKSYINYYTGQYTIVNLPTMVSNKDYLVPTTNTMCYSGDGGEINSIVAPISEMKGDTLILKGTHTKSNQFIYCKIVLE
jgi:hypothetical protein